ncbi:MAG: aldo/keto reductase [bacterium]
MQTFTFRNNDTISALGLGTWKSEPGEVFHAVKFAIETGYRHIDCAPIYGNEPEIGQALQESFASGTVKRDEIWITSKLWNDSHLPEDVEPALQRTLRDLKLQYLDLFLIHWPVALKRGIDFPRGGKDMLSYKEAPLTATWQAMEELVDKGMVRHIGVSNFGAGNLSLLMESARIKPEMNQVELHPYLTQTGLVQFCHEHGILITAYSPLGSSDRAAGLKSRDEPVLLEDTTVKEIATIHDCTPAQVLIAWSLRKGYCVIPKSVHEGRIKQNLQAEQVILSESEISKIDKLNKGYRYVNGDFWVKRDGPYAMEDIWY